MPCVYSTTVLRCARRRRQVSRTDKELTELGECIYDQGGYFVINGSEKVSRKRRFFNFVCILRKKLVFRQTSPLSRAILHLRSYFSLKSLFRVRVFAVLYGSGRRKGGGGRGSSVYAACLCVQQSKAVRRGATCFFS